MIQVSVSFEDMLNEANRGITCLSVQEAQDALEDEHTVFVDLRDIRELKREGMIPGAFHCPRGMLEFWIHPESPYHKPIFAQPKKFIFYCGSGWRSALAVKSAQSLGLAPVSHITGGFTDWKASGGSLIPLN